MVVYYLNKVSERLADYHYPIKEGDICMLYDGDAVKTIYVDSETEADSIWRDFKFIDSKSLKSYHLPKTDSVLCAPIGDKHAFGDTKLLTQLIQECKGEWLLDFLNETSAVLSGFVDYWDLMVLRRLTGDDDIEIAYGDEEALSAYIDAPDEDDEEELEDDDEDEYTDVDILPKSYDIKWFCLSVLSCIEGQMDKRSYQIFYDTLNGEPRSEIASRFHLTQERIRQIVVKAIKQAKELFIEQRKSLDEAKAENAKLRVQMNLMREDMSKLKALIPQEVSSNHAHVDDDINADLTELLEKPLTGIKVSVRATNILLSMGVTKFADIPQIDSSMTLLSVRNSGRKTVHEISQLLEDFHLTFGLSLTEVVVALNENDWYAAKRKWMGGESKKSITDSETEGCGNRKENRIVKTEEATIVLTREIVETGRTPNGGFTKSQLAALGVDWPAPDNWIQEKVGTMITPTQLEDFNRIEYVAKSLPQSYQEKSRNSYKSVASNSEDLRRMEAILQALSHFYAPATPRDIARTVSRSAWGDEIVREDTVDSYLKRLPEVEYVKWGRYILKSRHK
jgi:hypothetical protein